MEYSAAGGINRSVHLYAQSPVGPSYLLQGWRGVLLEVVPE